MKRRLVLFALTLVILASCAPKSYYQTAEGKRKLKYYNAIQFGQKERPKMKF